MVCCFIAKGSDSRPSGNRDHKRDDKKHSDARSETSTNRASMKEEKKDISN